MKANTKILAFSLAAAALSANVAHAGYDADSGMAMGSRSSNMGSSNMGSSKMGMRRTTTRTTTTRTTYYNPTMRYNTTRYNRNIVTQTMINGKTMLTVNGMLMEDADDKNFRLVDAVGRIYDVETSNFVNAEAANKLQKGDKVRIYGEFRDNKLFASNLRTMGMADEVMITGKRVYYAPYYYTIGANQSVTGTLVEDADDNEFEVRDSMGRVYMIRTRTIADSYGLNKLQEGQRVRVYGYWFVSDSKPQIEASNVTVLR